MSDINVPQIKNEDFIFLPLGGVGEIGMNVSLYHYKGKWIMVDLGAGFAEEDMPGINMLVPNINFIEDRKQDLLGIVITHGHEDHIGALPYLVQKLKYKDSESGKEVKPKIYTSQFTANFINVKLGEYGIADNVEMVVVQCQGEYQLGPFKLEFASITHSIIEAMCVLITTESGACFHTGDWKFDHTPVIGPATDMERIKLFGTREITAMTCDSTNVFSPGRSGSEGEVYDNIYNIVKEASGTVLVPLFASNVARIRTVCNAAQACERKIAICGTSLRRIVVASQKSGYLNDVEFIPEIEISKYDRDKMLIICTGCQGEELAAAARLSNDNHRFAKLQHGDTVLFSSKVIPGNEKRILKIYNKFICKGIKLITERTHHVHVSGHPYRGEIQEMYEMIKPEIAIPVHGEYIHLYEHAKFAKEQCGVDDAFVPDDGMIIKIDKCAEKGRKVEKIGSVEFGYFGIDGRILQSPDSTIMEIRRRMSSDGIVIIVISLNKSGTMVLSPVIMFPGLLDITNRLHREFMKLIKHKVINYIEDKFENKKSKNSNYNNSSFEHKGNHVEEEDNNANIVRSELKSAIKKMVRSIVRHRLDKHPQIEIQIELVKH